MAKQVEQLLIAGQLGQAVVNGIPEAQVLVDAGRS